MRKLSLSTVTVFLGLVGLSEAADLVVELPAKHFDLIESYCLDCHDGETQKGKVNLEALSFKVDTLEQAGLWQKVLDVMNSGEMPPENKRQPKNEEKADFLDDLAQTMVLARRKLSDSGGKITMRRLNRREYHNTIESLTGVSLNVESLPSDEGTGTFDTVGASQFISSDQFEQYLRLGRTAIDEAFTRYSTQAKPTGVFRIEPENTVNVQSAKNMKQMEETYERYLGWKAGVDKATLAPENQKALEQIRKKYKLADLTDNIRLYQNANLLKGVPDPKKFGFKDANDASFSYRGGYGRSYAYLKHYAELPLSDRGTYLKLGWGIQRIDVTPPKDKLVPGTYKLRIRAGSVNGSDPKRHFIQIGHPQRLNRIMAGFKGKPISGHQINGTTENPEIIETTVKIGADTPREFGIQERQPEDRNLHRKEFFRIKKENGYGYPPAVWVDWIELVGPLMNAGTKTGLARILTENLAGPKESESERARKILSEFSLTAFRQVKPAPKFIDQLLALFKSRRTAGEPFQVAIRTPLGVILASPGFLYLNEPSAEKQRRTLTDRELAVRLAYFLWSASPDAELLALAAVSYTHLTLPTT